MCYKKKNDAPQEEVEQRYEAEVKPGDQYKISFAANGFSHPTFHIIRQDSPQVLTPAIWGLIPHFAKGKSKEDALKYAKSTLNCRHDSVFNPEKPSFRGSYKADDYLVKRQRCIIPVTGFFENMQFNKVAYPHHIYLKSEKIFSLGGIYSEWIHPEGFNVTSYSVITTNPNPLLEVIHNKDPENKRMPFIIPKEREKEWLGGLSDAQINDFLTPYDMDDMDFNTITRVINNAKVNSNVPETLVPVEYPELAMVEYR